MARRLTMEEDLNFVALLKECAARKDLYQGSRLHRDILKQGSLGKNPYLVSALVTMYAKCGAFARAQSILEEIPDQNVASWNALVSGYVQQGQGWTALRCYEKMQTKSISPNNVTFICVLKACGSARDLEFGKKIHDKIDSENLLKKDIMLGTALVDMYAKCSALAKARQVLNELPFRNVVTWSALMSGYAQMEALHDVLECLEQMQREGISPNSVTFICILKACGVTGAIEEGRQLHNEIVTRGFLDDNVVIGNSIVDMYAKCGKLEDAHGILEKLLIRSTISWFALIAGYVQQSRGEEALYCFECMIIEGLSPDAITFIFVLKACGIMKDLEKGIKIHEKILSTRLLEGNVMLGTALVDMYAKCNALEKARKVLGGFPFRDVISWNAIIAGWIHHGQYHEAWADFESMKSEGISPNATTFICILKACGAMKSIEEGEQIHENIVNRGLLLKDIALGNALIDMYTKCGVLAKANKVFEELPVRNLVTWNILIAGYAEWGQGQKALDCFEWLVNEGLSPNSVTFVGVMKACGSTRAIDRGICIHNEISEKRMLDKDIALGNALVDMYAKFGMLGKAQEVHQQLPVRDVVTWNSLIAGYTEQGQYDDALNCFGWMKKEDLCPDSVTFLCILKACGNLGAVDKGKLIHDEIMSRGLLETDTVLGTALVDMYAKCGMIDKACSVLEALSSRDIVSWNAVIAGRAQQGQGYEAIESFKLMQNEGLSPDAVTFICILKACSNIGALDEAMKIHNQIRSTGFLEKDIALGNSLVDMYCKCGVIMKAQQVVKALPVRNQVTWNTLIAGYAQQGQSHEVFKCFEEMLDEGLCPDVFTLISLLKACGNVGAIDKGQQIHENYINQGLLENDMILGNALVDMYAKCGSLVTVQKLIKELPMSNVVTWNTVLGGYAQQGQGHEALNCFDQMQSHGISPDGVTFLCVLSACGHSGLLQEALILFRNMAEKYKIIPNVEHHTCMVIIFGFAGYFDTAMSVIEMMPSSDHSSVWLALLNACTKWENVELGRLAFDHILKLDHSCAAAYVFMANLFTVAGMQEDADKLESLRLKYADASQKGNWVWDSISDIMCATKSQIIESFLKGKEIVITG